MTLASGHLTEGLSEPHRLSVIAEATRSARQAAEVIPLPVATVGDEASSPHDGS